MKTLSIVIPVYNEQDRLTKTFKTLEKGFCFDGLKLEKIIFVNDGSTDKTQKILLGRKNLLEKKLKTKMEIITYPQNQGKGYAVKTGMLASKSDYTLFMDADIATPLTELDKFLPFINQSQPVIIGTRKNGESTVKVPQPLYRQVLGRGFTYFANFILNAWVTDFTCGFKLFSKQAKNDIFSQSTVKRWAFDAEIMFLAKKFGYPITEKAVYWYDDKKSKVNLFVDLPRTVFEIVQLRINHFELLLPSFKKPVLVRLKI